MAAFLAVRRRVAAALLRVAGCGARGVPRAAGRTTSDRRRVTA